MIALLLWPVLSSNSVAPTCLRRFAPFSSHLAMGLPTVTDHRNNFTASAGTKYRSFSDFGKTFALASDKYGAKILTLSPGGTTSTMPFRSEERRVGKEC